jgi:hypothetical protein
MENVERETEAAVVKLKLPPTKRKLVPFNQRTEINEASPSTKLNSVDIAKDYVKKLHPN